MDENLKGRPAIFKSVEFILNTLRKLGIKWGGGRDFLYLLRAFIKKTTVSIILMEKD